PNKVSVVQQTHGMHPLTSLLPYSNEHFNPSSPHLPTDMSQKPGVHRHQSQDLSSFYSLPPGGVSQITPPMSWSAVRLAVARGSVHPNPYLFSPPTMTCRQSQPVYPLSSCGFRQPYSSSLPSSSSYSRFPHSLMLGPSGMHPTGIPHPAIVPPSGKQDHDQFDRNMYAKPHSEPKREREPKKPVIKKPLNAFMLYMKEMRAKVIAECTLKESAAINQILGRRWHALTREEQAKYYELARKERQLHMQLYPSWSARDNYGKRKRRKREKQQDSATGTGAAWRKKKCIRYLQGGQCTSPHSSDGSAIDSPSSPVRHLPQPTSPSHCPSPCPMSPISLHTAQSNNHSTTPPPPLRPSKLSLAFSKVKAEAAVHCLQPGCPVPQAH
ncbi:hypothetical protein NFI96_019959, partial [Prochilodus magdalenae]